MEAMKETITYKNPRDLKAAKMAEQVTRNFFENRLNPIEKTPAKSEAVVDDLAENLDESTIAELEQVLKSKSSDDSKNSKYALE